MSKRKNLGLLLVLFCALVMLVGAGEDDDKGWTRLDEADTSHANAATVNKSEFTINDKDRNEGYTKLRVRNHGPSVRFTEIDILYSNNDVQKIEMDKVAENNEGTGPIDLKGKMREIRKVVAVYKVVGHHRAAGKLTLWGFK